MNEGVRISAIIEVLERSWRAHCERPRTFCRRHCRRANRHRDHQCPMVAQRPHRDSTPADPASHRGRREDPDRADDQSRWTRVCVVLDGAGERVEIEGDYGNRCGYDSNSLPSRCPCRSSTARIQLRACAGRAFDPFELNYEHFSIVTLIAGVAWQLHAVNIDGKAWRAVNRDTGEPSLRDLGSSMTGSMRMHTDQQHYSRSSTRPVFRPWPPGPSPDPTCGPRALPPSVPTPTPSTSPTARLSLAVQQAPSCGVARSLCARQCTSRRCAPVPVHGRFSRRRSPLQVHSRAEALLEGAGADGERSRCWPPR